MGRILARETAFKVIYKSFFIDDNFSTSEIIEEDNIDAEGSEFVNNLVQIYKEHKEQLENKIITNLQGYTFDRIYKIDKAILMTALAEMLYYKQTPYKVVINEAVEMAKKYSTEKSYSFVNGILKKIVEGEKIV